MIDRNFEVEENYRLEKEADRQSDLYSEGEFDGKIALEPSKEKLLEISYRQGYQQGIIDYWIGQYNLKLDMPF